VLVAAGLGLAPLAVLRRRHRRSRRAA
jgi:hypothetical protein